MELINHIFITIVLLLFTLQGRIHADDIDDILNTEQHHKEYIKEFTKRNANLMVSTIDGKISSLDLRSGKLLWASKIGEDPLIRSSLTKLLIKEGNKNIRLIPSLNGDLFRFDGKSVEAVPYTAEQLLSSSFRVADNQLLVGGREVTTFGLDATNGKTLYECTSEGCKQVSDVSSDTDVIVVKRQQQTVRSVESRHGMENWNFSVGEVALDLVRGNKENLLTLQTEIYEDEFQHEFEHNTNFCEDSFYGENEGGSACEMVKRLKIMVPEGLVVSLSDDGRNAKWKHVFDNPIAKVWAVINGHVINVDLFDPDFVPALKTTAGDAFESSIYLGSYEDYFYIQSSSEVRDAVKSAALSSNRPRKGTINPYYTLPKFAYHPYLANTDHLTQATVGEAPTGEVAMDGNPHPSGKCQNQLAVYLDNPLQRHGFYFRGENIHHHIGKIRFNTKKGRHTHAIHMDFNHSYEYFIDELYLSAYIYWKELLALTLVLSVFIQLLISKCLQVYKEKNQEPASTSNNEEYAEAKSALASANDASLNDHQIEHEYESRFLHDFEPVRRLGKGGFGIVFEVRNKVDDCSYAVKRITLPNKSKARNKVMREVRALAKLDHPRIVRYFHSWTEEPPMGWQQNLDKQWNDELSQTFTLSPTESSPYKRNKEHTVYSNTRGESGNMRGGFMTESFAITPNQSRRNSESFIIFDNNLQQSTFKPSKFFESNETSGTESSDDSDEKEAKETSQPFKRYGHSRGDSFSIVFENDDSAIEVEHDRSKPFDNFADSLAADDHTNEFNIQTASGLRKRSLKTSQWDKSSTSNLKEVVCKANAQRPESFSQSIQSPSNVYLYIQMQLCKKESLSEWLGGTVDRDPRQCMWIFQQVVSAVDYIHDKNLIHRDLKPSNIFFSVNDNSIKVGDFGLVTEMEEGTNDIGTPCHGSPVRSNKQLQGHTEQVGTTMYMAPEQMNSSNYTQKVDIYALGLILVELFVPYSTQMERIRILRDARQHKFTKTFQRNHPKEVELVTSMLAGQAHERPNAADIAIHEALDIANDFEETLPTTRRHRTLSTKSSLSNSL